MDIRIIREPITPPVLNDIAQKFQHTLIKGVADVERQLIALGGEWHMDANSVLIADGSVQQNLWDFNLYPEERGEKAIEYISLINIRPSQGNTAMELADKHLRDTIRGIVGKLVPDLGL